MNRILSGCIVAVYMMMGLAGCSAPSTSDEPGPDSLFTETLAEARASGVSAQQIAILERVSHAGEVSVADVQEAFEGTRLCLENAGIRVTVRNEVEPWGVERFAYDMFVPEDQALDPAVLVGDACIAEHSGLVERLYALQPLHMERIEAHRADVVMPGLRACLTRFGVAVEEDPSFAELWDEAYFARTEQGERSDADGTLGECLQEFMQQAG